MISDCEKSVSGDCDDGRTWGKGAGPGYRCLPDFARFDGLVDHHGRVTESSTCGSQSVARGDREIVARALHGVGVAVALGPGQAHRAGSEEIFHAHATAITTNAVVFGPGDWQEIQLHAAEDDYLR